MQEVRYKQKDGIVLDSNDMPLYFTGYKITRDFNRVSSILELSEGKPIGQIRFRPTKTPVIFNVTYGSYNEERYNNGSISTTYCTNHQGIQGEFVRYNVDGSVLLIRYYSDSIDITEEIKSFIGFKGDNESFKLYKFAEDELFNLYMRYGNKFKLYNEYKWESNYFDSVATFCL